MRSRGFVLLELIAALAILGVVATGGMVVLYLHAKNVRGLFEEKVAAQLASGELERLEARGFEGVEEGTAELAEGSRALEQLREGRCTLEVTRDRDDPSLFHARVRVRWRDGRFQREAEMDTLFRRR